WIDVCFCTCSVSFKTDEDECTFENPVCVKNAVCYNTIGSYYCQCETGFQDPSKKVNFTQEDRQECKDFNECLELRDICGPNSTCHNTEGSYFCTCNHGFISSNRREIFSGGQGVTCDDRDECSEDIEICGQQAKCINTISGYYCICDQGYRLASGETNFTGIGRCEHVCKIDKSLCGGGNCSRAKDGYECICNPGFTNYGIKKMKCTKPNSGFLNEDMQLPYGHEQIHPELVEIIDKLRNFSVKLREGDENMTKEKWEADAHSLLEEFLNALDRLLSADSLKSNRNVTIVLELTENVLKMLGPMLPNVTKSALYTAVNMMVRRDDTSPDGPFSLSTKDVEFKSHWETAAGDSYLGFAAVSLLRFENLTSSVNGYFGQIWKNENETLEINSKVVTAAVTNAKTTKLRKNITLNFPHLKPSDRRAICVFWNSRQNDGAWSTEGCTVVNSSANHTVCSCNHLSSFAVLMALHKMEDVFELQLITWVGLSLSLICLLICMLTFRFVRSIQSTRTTIHLHLCISLFIADLVFLAGITQTQNKVGCAFVAGLLHFFFLAAFCWMCLEGVQLFRMVVLVFNTTLRPLYLMAGGYGIPALIVIISASINAKGYGTESHCWLSLDGGFIWSFFAPVCVIIVVNIFFFLITVWKLAQKFSSLNQDLNKLDKIKSFTITAIAQLCVLGTMWIFGCFQFEGRSPVMSYLFTILNSLQGVLVFVMHCLLSKQVREEYAKILTSMCAPEKKKYSEFSTNQSSKTQASGSGQHTGESHI
ncbi:hypothetical protein NFI96_025167, partial [Prochilodus magdalenae]